MRALVHGIGTLSLDNYLADPEPLVAAGAAALHAEGLCSSSKQK